MRGLITDCNYILPWPHAVAAAAAQVCTAVPDCRGVDYTSEVIKDILLSGIYDLNVRREVLSTAEIEDKTVNELVRIVKANEAARDAAGGNRPAATAAAASSYKKSARQETTSRPQLARPRSGPPNGARPKKARCRCGNEFTDFAIQPDGTFNQSPYKSCRDCFRRNKKASRENKGGRSSVAVAASGGPVFEPPPTGCLPPREARISSATVAHTNTRLCGQASGHSNHPRLEVLMFFATPGGQMELKVKDAVADSGAQIMIVLASLLSQSGIKIEGLRQSKIDLRAVNNARIDVQGLADAKISALSLTGERFVTSTRIYVVRNVGEVYLSLDVLVGLRIVNKFFFRLQEPGTNTVLMTARGSGNSPTRHTAQRWTDRGESRIELGNTSGSSSHTTTSRPHTRIGSTLHLAAKEAALGAQSWIASTEPLYCFAGNL